MAMLGRVIFCGALGVTIAACTVVSCPANMTCTLKQSEPAAGGKGGGGSGGGSADAGTGDSSEGGQIEDDGGNGAPDLPPGDWVNVTGSLKGLASGCGNLSGLFIQPETDLLIPGVLQQGLWSSKAGPKWARLGTGTGSDVITNSPLTLVFDPDDRDHFWEAGIYGATGGVYETKDGGDTFTALPMSGSDSLSVAFSDPQRKILLAAGHEHAQAVFKSTDGGTTWANISDDLPKDRWCTVTLALDSKTYLVGCGLSGGLTGIYRTADGGKTWKQVSDGGGALRPLQAADGSIYWSSAGNGQLVRSTDDGKTWTEVMRANVLPGRNPIELPDGRIVAIGPKTLVVSSNHGITWDYASAYLPFATPAGVVYSATQRAFFLWHNDCGNVVLDDAVMRFDFDYETQ